MMLKSPPTVEVHKDIELPERRYVYNGGSTGQSTDYPLKRNRAVKRRKRSPFDLIFMLFSISILIVFYIWNKIIVNRLVVDVHDLQTQHQKIMSTNEVLRAEITKKSSLERIETISARQLGLTYPKEQAIWFDVDIERMEQLMQHKR
jgi:cell division protein FtsL